MFRTINDFLESWKYESEATLKVFGNLTDESLNQKVTSDGRSLKRLARHITISNPEMLLHSGLTAGEFDETIPPPDRAEEIIKEYERTSSLVVDVVLKNWKDENLSEDIKIYGDVWKKGKVLSVLITHQTHHRGQMTVLMRQAGLKVPGVYGPAKEEWEKFGMPTQE